jgi:hypothetical protein
MFPPAEEAKVRELEKKHRVLDLRGRTSLGFAVMDGIYFTRSDDNGHTFREPTKMDMPLPRYYFHDAEGVRFIARSVYSE